MAHTTSTVANEGLGALVRRERTRRGWTVTRLAEAAGMSKSEISMIETGRVKLPGAAKRRALASALGLRHVDVLIAAGELAPEELGPELPARPGDAAEQALLERYRRLSPEERSGMDVVLAVMVRDRHPLIPPELTVAADALPVS